MAVAQPLALATNRSDLLAQFMAMSPEQLASVASGSGPYADTARMVLMQKTAMPSGPTSDRSPYGNVGPGAEGEGLGGLLARLAGMNGSSGDPTRSQDPGAGANAFAASLGPAAPQQPQLDSAPPPLPAGTAVNAGGGGFNPELLKVAARGMGLSPLLNIDPSRATLPVDAAVSAGLLNSPTPAPTPDVPTAAQPGLWDRAKTLLSAITDPSSTQSLRDKQAQRYAMITSPGLYAPSAPGMPAPTGDVDVSGAWRPNIAPPDMPNFDDLPPISAMSGGAVRGKDAGKSGGTGPKDPTAARDTGISKLEVIDPYSEGVRHKSELEPPDINPKEDRGLAIMAAGLGMLNADPSKGFLSALGQGGLTGLKEYAQSSKENKAEMRQYQRELVAEKHWDQQSADHRREQDINADYKASEIGIQKTREARESAHDRMLAPYYNAMANSYNNRATNPGGRADPILDMTRAQKFAKEQLDREGIYEGTPEYAAKYQLYFNQALATRPDINMGGAAAGIPTYDSSTHSLR